MTVTLATIAIVVIVVIAIVVLANIGGGGATTTPDQPGALPSVNVEAPSPAGG
jgi:hypothetical protein